MVKRRLKEEERRGTLKTKLEEFFLQATKQTLSVEKKKKRVVVPL